MGISGNVKQNCFGTRSFSMSIRLRCLSVLLFFIFVGCVPTGFPGAGHAAPYYGTMQYDGLQFSGDRDIERLFSLFVETDNPRNKDRFVVFPNGKRFQIYNFSFADFIEGMGITDEEMVDARADFEEYHGTWDYRISRHEKLDSNNYISLTLPRDENAKGGHIWIHGNTEDHSSAWGISESLDGPVFYLGSPRSDVEAFFGKPISIKATDR